MGWNSWYIYLHHVTEAGMRSAADQMISSGMADYGYQYVNCDDCWARQPGLTNAEVGDPVRDASGQILPNGRFPDIKGMVDYIHAKGLKAGILFFARVQKRAPASKEAGSTKRRMPKRLPTGVLIFLNMIGAVIVMFRMSAIRI